jgi:hypothetical protein
MVQHKSPGTLVTLDLKTVLQVIERALQVVMSQPMLLRIGAPVTIGTDIHG